MKLTSLLVQLLVAELGMLVMGSTMGGLNTITLFGFSLLGKAAVVGGVWLEK